MAKIMKYELIKNRFRYLTMVAVMALVEVGFLITNFVGYKASTAMWILLMLAAFGTFIIVLFEGIAMYNRDLREKSGYMIFMTPLPAWQILLGKIIVILAVGSVLFIGYCFLGYADLHLLADVMKNDNAASAKVAIMTSFLNSLYGMDTVITILRIFGYLVCFVAFFVCLAYLSSTLGASLLRGKKGERLISCVICIGLLILVTYISSRISNSGAGFRLYITKDTGIYFSPASGNEVNVAVSLIFELGCALAAFAASAYLLDRKVDI
ncbi:MAG: hypothetical protein ACI4CS_09925 [Candidatus Weimeria sp.]